MNNLNDPRYSPTMTISEIYAQEIREQALNDAYADGRADERQEWAELLDAAICAANVLYLLDDEVKALGLGAGNVRGKLRAAIEKITGEKAAK
jgi:hypothetical protein